MAQILIINSSDSKISNFIQSNLIKRYGHEVITKDSAKDAISFLSIMGQMDAILVLEGPGKSDCQKMSDYLVTNDDDKHAHLILFTDKTYSYSKITYLDFKASAEKASHTIGFLLGNEKEPYKDPIVKIEVKKEVTDPQIKLAELKKLEEQEKKEKEEKTTVFVLPPKVEKPKPEVLKPALIQNADADFIGIDINYFFSRNDLELKSEIFTRIKKGNNYDFQLKYTKDFILTKTELDRAITRGVSSFFVRRSDYSYIKDILNKNLLDYFNQSVSEDDKFKVCSIGFELLAEIFRKQLLDSFTIELIKVELKILEQLVNRPDSMFVFLRHLKAKKISHYSYLHIHLTALLLYKVVDDFEWSKDFTKNKILYFAVFHDLALGSNRLIKIHHHYETERKNLVPEDEKLIQVHSDLTSKVLEKIIKVPKELVALIREHHGVIDGKQMGDGINIRILPFSKLIVVIEDFVTKYLDEQLIHLETDPAKFTELNHYQLPKEKLQSLLNDLKVKYNKGGYVEAVSSIENYFYPKDSAPSDAKK